MYLKKNFAFEEFEKDMAKFKAEMDIAKTQAEKNSVNYKFDLTARELVARLTVISNLALKSLGEMFEFSGACFFVSARKYARSQWFHDRFFIPLTSETKIVFKGEGPANCFNHLWRIDGGLLAGFHNRKDMMHQFAEIGTYTVEASASCGAQKKRVRDSMLVTVFKLKFSDNEIFKESEANLPPESVVPFKPESKPGFNRLARGVEGDLPAGAGLQPAPKRFFITPA